MLNCLQEYPEIMNVHEAAKVLNCSAKTVSKLCREGQLKAMKIGKGWSIPQISLEDFILFQAHYRTTY